MPLRACLVDTNVLLRWVRRDDSMFALVSKAMDDLAQQGVLLCYTSQIVSEFWNTCTRPADRNGYAMTPEQADREARVFENQLALLPDIPAVHEEWRRLIVLNRVSGAQVHDARLVAAMVVHGVDAILTLNDKDFTRYENVRVLHPESVER